MKTYSQDLRDRVIRACDEGRHTREQIAQLFDVSTSWIRRLLKRRRETGSYQALPKGGPIATKVNDQHRSRLLVLLQDQPDATLAQLRDRLGAPVHLTTIHRNLIKMKITVKKKVLHASEQDRPDVRHKRAIFRGRTAKIDPDRFVFLDEAGTNTSMTRLFGRAPKDERVVDKVPQGDWHNTTLIGAIRLDGVTAAMTIEGALDTMAFQTYVQEILVPTLRVGDIVVLDNLKPHKNKAIARAIRKAGAGVWYLPPYSPDYNPIEKIWAKVKSYLRKVGARTTEALWQAIEQALALVTAEDCRNCFDHCGYTATFECNLL